MSNEEIIRAFHLMWDNFPEAVMITQKSREIVALNKKAAEYGLQVGVKCSSIGKPENHKGCLCNQAVDTGEPVFITYEGAFGKAYGYWIPIPEKPEWIIHFGVGHAFEYKKIDRSPSKKSESIHGLTRGTEMESAMAAMAQGEANGVMMYYALARLAKEQGLNEVASTFIESANQEAVHAGFYATLNGKYPKEFWQFAAGIAKAEYSGKTKIKGLADMVRAAGFATAADEMEIFAEQEWHHGVVIDELLKKYAPKISEPSGQKKWVCSVCGYEHTGDEPPESCPVCGQPKNVFKEKNTPQSLHGLTKGTELESLSTAAARAEINGTLMYYSLARLAKEQGLDEVAKILLESANQEAVHAGFYATLNGKYPQDFWALLDKVKNLEYEGEGRVKALADKYREAGLNKAADEMEVFAKEEGHHGVVIEEIFKKYKPDYKPAAASGERVYVCPCCGYEYIGDINSESDDWTCPVCSQPKKDFKLKEKVAVAQKVFVCTICGYEHKGDSPPETCPLCGQPASAFKEKV